MVIRWAHGVVDTMLSPKVLECVGLKSALMIGVYMRDGEGCIVGVPHDRGVKISRNLINGLLEVTLSFDELHPHIPSVFIYEEGDILIAMD